MKITKDKIKKVFDNILLGKPNKRVIVLSAVNLEQFDKMMKEEFENTKMTQLEILQKTKKSDITLTLLLNVWLDKYFQTTIEEIEKSGKYRKDDSRAFYQDYAVTQEQHDWWYYEVLKVFKKKFGARLGKETLTWAYLDSAPTVKI